MAESSAVRPVSFRYTVLFELSLVISTWTFEGFRVVIATAAAMNTSHPHKRFSSMLSDPVHATAAKAEPRSSTGQSQFLQAFSQLSMDSIL